MLKHLICFMLTNKCSAKCGICCCECGPEKNDVMPEDLLLQTIDGLTRADGINGVGFSGGEPFLHYDLLKKGLSRAKRNGFSTSVATNGFWGQWEDDVILERLRGLDVDFISFSTDFSHAAFVGDEVLGRAVSAAKSLDIKLSLAVGENKKDPSAGEYYRAMGAYKYLSVFSVYPHVRIGRAASLGDENFYRFTPLNRASCQSRGLITVRYDGRVFPCCSPYVFDTVLSLGNIKERGIEEILSDRRNSYIFSALRLSGFGKLVETAKNKYGFHFNDPCSDGCEVCHALFGDSAHIEEFGKIAEAEYGRIAANHILGRTLDGGRQ
jgi:MoaA/NifB/PqqE/SkfB family radical SAM enzyme